jgi:hypothetical protein
MSFMPGGGFEDLFGAFPGSSGPKQPSTRVEEKGVPWEAKIIDGQYYIPLSQVADLLRANNVLPKVRAGIERRVEKGPPKFVRESGSETANDQVNKGP